MSALLKAAMMLAEVRPLLLPPEFDSRLWHLETAADQLLIPIRGDPEEERVANRLRKRRHWLFTFLKHPQVEATNNRAERALHPAVITRKLSCGNKTRRGKITWEILASLGATCRQRGVDLVHYLQPDLLLPSPYPAR